MKFGRHYIVLLSFSLVAMGCAALTVEPPGKNGFDEPVLYFQKQSHQFEQEGEYDLARRHLEIACSLAPDNRHLAADLDRLTSAIQQRAEQYHIQGAVLYKTKKNSAAQTAWLKALRTAPSRQDTRQRLTESQPGYNLVHYPVKTGDTPATIAAAVYNDPGKAFMVAYFGGFNDKAPTTTAPLPGAVITLPRIDDLLTKWRTDDQALTKRSTGRESQFEKELAEAAAFLENGDYEYILPLTRQILAADPGNPRALEMENHVHYHRGIRLAIQKKYPAALAELENTDRNFKDTAAQIDRLKKEMTALSAQHYRIGVRYFLKEDLEKAVSEWETAVELDPANTKAVRDMNNARQLIEKLKTME
jgi:tetratricopeptide (TPR) repeat protein